MAGLIDTERRGPGAAAAVVKNSLSGVDSGGPDRRRENVVRWLAAHRPRVAGLGFGCARIGEMHSMAPDPVEYRLAAHMVPERRGDFLLGRRALRRALTEIGGDPGPVRMTGRRPRLPAGWVGTITHSAGVAAALAGSDTRFRSLGVDLELSPLPLEAAHLVLGAQEREWATAAGEPAAGRLTAAFAAKEAAFKALDPVLAGGGPRLLDIWLRPARGGFLAKVAEEPAVRLHVLVRSLPLGAFAWTALGNGPSWRR